MNDLTTGSLTRHLLQTTSYMLVTMLFQTLYVLVDLYWVGRLGTEAVAAVGISGNLLFIVLAATQMLGVGTTTLVAHAVGRRDQERANLVFNQALVLSTVVGAIFLALAFALDARLRRGAQRRRAHPRPRGPVSALVHPLAGVVVPVRRDGSCPARHREFPARDDRPDSDRHPQHHAGAGADLRLGHGPADGCGRRCPGHVPRHRHRRRLDDVVLPAGQRVHQVPRHVGHNWRPASTSGQACSRSDCPPAPSSR